MPEYLGKAQTNPSTLHMDGTSPVTVKVSATNDDLRALHNQTVRITGPLVDTSGEYRGDTPEEIEAHHAFEEQLKYTAAMIGDNFTGHFHFTDDCGDYLKAGLRLSSLLQDARMDGPAALLEAMRGLLEEATDIGYLDGDPGFESPFDRSILRMDYACDGVSSVLYEWAERWLS